MPNKPAPCGLRTRHPSHAYGDHDELWCDGKAPPAHYDPKHRGQYRPEPDWWTTLASAFRCRHREGGAPVLADEPRYPRSHPRLLWRDRKTDCEDDTG